MTAITRRGSAASSSQKGQSEAVETAIKMAKEVNNKEDFRSILLGDGVDTSPFFVMSDKRLFQSDGRECLFPRMMFRQKNAPSAFPLDWRCRMAGGISQSRIPRVRDLFACRRFASPRRCAACGGAMASRHSPRYMLLLLAVPRLRLADIAGGARCLLRLCDPDRHY